MNALLVALLAVPLGAALAAQAPPQQLTPGQMAADLRQLAREAAAKWAYAEDRRRNGGPDLSAMADASIARLDGVHDDAAFVGLVREFVAAMHDSHAFVQWTGTEPHPFRRWPFTVVDTQDGLVIDEVLPTWTNAPAAFTRGDLLLEVDGAPVARLVTDAELRTMASTAGSRRRWALRRVVFHDRDPSHYKVRRADGSEVVVEAAAAARHPEADVRPTAVESRRLADGIAYVRIPTFALADQEAWRKARPAERPALLSQDIAAIRAAFASAADCRAVVLDLRGNGGGTDLLGMEVAACVLPADSVYYGLASRGLFGWPSKPGLHRLHVAGTPPRFAGQLVVLIDEDVCSVTDNLCRCLDDLHGDVTFVGRPTSGGSGAPRPCVTLEHSKVVVGFCTMRVHGPNGDLIEGRGTKPDVFVPVTRDDVLAGRDAALAAALRAVR